MNNYHKNWPNENNNMFILIENIPFLHSNTKILKTEVTVYTVLERRKF